MLCLSSIALSYLANLSLSQAESVTFPGKCSEAISPNGHKIIRNIPDRQLFFERKGQKSLSPLPLHFTTQNTYDGNVNILWSPDSSRFVLNDWFGCDESNAYLYRANDTHHPVDCYVQVILA